MLAEKKECYEKTGKNLKVTPAKYKAEFPWLKEVDSLALCNAQLHLQTAYKNFFRDPSFGFPRFKSKKNPVKSYTTNSVNGNILLKEGKLKLPKTGWIRIRQHRKIREDACLKGASVCLEADGRYYVFLLFFVTIAPLPAMAQFSLRFRQFFLAVSEIVRITCMFSEIQVKKESC